MSEKKYSMLFNKMLDGYALHEIICDKKGNPVDYRFLDINPVFEKLTGLEADKLLGKRVLEVLPGIESSWIKKYGKVALTGVLCQFENYAKELNKYFEITSFCPKKGQFACIFQDITKRKQADEKIKDLALFPEENDNPVFRITKDAELLYINNPGKKLFGDQLEKIKENIPEKWIKKIWKEAKAVNYKISINKKIIHFYAKPILNKNYINIYAIDITTQKEAEDELKEALKQNKILLNEIQHRVKNNFSMISSMITIAASSKKMKKKKQHFKIFEQE